MRTHILKSGDGQPTGVAGDIYTIKVSGRETGGAYAVMEAFIPSGHGPLPHQHSREDEFFYVLDGTMEFVSDGQRSIGGPGTFVALPKGSVHCFQNVGDAPARMIITVVPAGLEDFFIEVSKNPDTFSEENPPVFDPQQIERMLALESKFGLRTIVPGNQ